MKSITINDDNHREPIDVDNISLDLVKSLFLLKDNGRITPLELIITYSYLFNGLSLNQLRDRYLKCVEGIHSFPSKQSIHQNVIIRVTNLMEEELIRMKKITEINRKKLLEEII